MFIRQCIVNGYNKNCNKNACLVCQVFKLRKILLRLKKDLFIPLIRFKYGPIFHKSGSLNSHKSFWNQELWHRNIFLYSIISWNGSKGFPILNQWIFPFWVFKKKFYQEIWKSWDSIVQQCECITGKLYSKLHTRIGRKPTV